MDDPQGVHSIVVYGQTTSGGWAGALTPWYRSATYRRSRLPSEASAISLPLLNEKNCFATGVA
jgi:hypothetical protein